MNTACRCFTATRRPSSVSTASSTSPIPPRPSARSTRKRPASTLPGTAALGADGSVGPGVLTRPPVRSRTRAARTRARPGQYTPRPAAGTGAQPSVRRARAGPRRPTPGRRPLASTTRRATSRVDRAGVPRCRGGRVKRLLPERWLRTRDAAARLQREPASEDRVEARRRIRVATALGTVSYLVFLALEWVRLYRGSHLEHSINLAHDAIGALLCGALLLLSRSTRVSDRTVLRMALGLELLLAALISLTVPWAGFLRTGYVPGLTWVVPIVILFPLLVPAPPRAVLGVTLASAAMMPAGIALLAATGRVTASVSNLVASSLTALVGAGIALVGSNTVHGVRTRLAAARQLGSYELLERLGQGGMGEVWRARHLMLARPSAIKLILPERLQAPAEAREVAIQRFTREAQVTASLRSPHTVELFDFGVSAEGTMYYAMELLEGMTLEHFVYRHGPVAPRRAVHWLRQACHSLAEAHARDLAHRDLKPANLIVCTFGRERDFLKVLDFGLARPALRAEDPRLTREGAWLGTPGWMAPEQVIEGLSGPRADLYAFGCVGYFMLTGVRPFEAQDLADLMRQHLLVVPARPSARAPQPIPEALEAVVMDCLAKDPDARPCDADELSERLARSVPGEPWSQADAAAWWNAQAPGG